MKISSEIQTAFEKENQMTIDEAWNYVQKWFKEKEYERVSTGCKEILHFVPEWKEVEELSTQAEQEIQALQTSPSPFSQEENGRATDSAKEIEKISEKKEKESQRVANAVIQAEKTFQQIKKGEFDWKGERFLSTIGYIGPLFFLPLFIRKESDLCQIHGKQALIIALFDWVATGVVSIFYLLAFFDWMVTFLLMCIKLFMMFHAWNGEKYIFPGFRDILSRF